MNRHFAKILILMAVLASVPLAEAADDEVGVEGVIFRDTGPLRVREQFLLGMGFYAFDPASADIQEQGDWQIDFVQSATNTWVLSESVENFLIARDSRQPITIEDLRGIEALNPGKGIYFADGEIYRASLAIRRGIGHNLQLSVTIPILSFGGGFSDGFIEGFHDTFGFSQTGRLGKPKDEYRVYLRDASGREIYRERRPGAGFGDIAISLKGRVPVRSGKWKVAWEGVVKLPTGDEDDLYSSGSEDYGAQLLATRYYSRSCIHVAVGFVRAGKSDVFSTDDQVLSNLMVGYEHAIGNRSSVIAQMTVSDSPFDDMGIEGLDERAYLIDLGVKRALTSRTVAFAALSENMLNFGSSADVGIHFGLTWTQ